MTTSELAKLSFAQLRDRLRTHTEELNQTDDLDLVQALRYLTTLRESEHTPDSIDALIQLARNFFFSAQPQEALQAASVAARLASIFDQQLLVCEARGIEGLALSDLGRFTEATIAHAESWRLARVLGDIEREGWAIKRVGDLWAAMAQIDAAMIYLGRARDLAARHDLLDLELSSRNNLAGHAIQLKDPEAGLRALLPLPNIVPATRLDVLRHANAHDTLGQLYVLTDDLRSARFHALESGRLAQIAGVKRTIQRHEALLGLIDVRSGEVERGLAAVERVLAYAKRVDHIDVVPCLSMCADAYESAGQSERALDYLQELFEWKKKSIDAEIVPLQYGDPPESMRFRPVRPFLTTRCSYVRSDCRLTFSNGLNISLRLRSMRKLPAGTICTERFA